MKTQGIDYLKRPSQTGENVQWTQKKWLHNIDDFMFEVTNVVILSGKYTGKIEITLGKHRDNAGNIAFPEWEPCKQ